MAFTTSDYQTNLAYRLGETAAPGDSTTSNQRLEWLNMAYFDIARRRNWFWQEATDTTNTNTGSTTGYDAPSDLKDFIQLKIGEIYYDEIPFWKGRIYTNALGIVTLQTLRRDYKFYRFGSKYYLLPTDNNDAVTHTIHYYKRVTKVTAGNSFLIPDEYSEALTAFAEARYWMSITQQAKAQVPFQEFEQIVKQMEEEHIRRGGSGAILDPEDAELFG